MLCMKHFTIRTRAPICLKMFNYSRNLKVKLGKNSTILKVTATGKISVNETVIS